MYIIVMITGITSLLFWVIIKAFTYNPLDSNSLTEKMNNKKYN